MMTTTIEVPAELPRTLFQRMVAKLRAHAGTAKEVHVYTTIRLNKRSEQRAFEEVTGQALSYEVLLHHAAVALTRAEMAKRQVEVEDRPIVKAGEVRARTTIPGPPPFGADDVEYFGLLDLPGPEEPVIEIDCSDLEIPEPPATSPEIPSARPATYVFTNDDGDEVLLTETECEIFCGELDAETAGSIYNMMPGDTVDGTGWSIRRRSLSEPVPTGAPTHPAHLERPAIRDSGYRLVAVVQDEPVSHRLTLRGGK